MAEQWQELAAARMTRFLAKKARHHKTRAYLATLPKRNKIIVTPEDYPRIVTRAEARLSMALQAKRDAGRYAEWEKRGKPPSPTIARKDRVRPRVRQRSPLLKIIAEAQGMVCAICGERLEFGIHPHERERVTYDHVIPRALGGADHNNRVAAHKGCNHKKAARQPTGCEQLLLAVVNAHLERHYAPPAQVDRNPKGHDPEEGHGRNDESPVAAISGDAPEGS